MKLDTQDYVAAVILYGGQLLRNDDYWRLFGFNGRPRRGRFFNKFINKDKLRRESFFIRECYVLSIAYYCKDDDVYGEVMEVLNGDMADDIYQALRFDNPDDVHVYLANGVDDYFSHKYLWGDVLKNRYEKYTNQVAEPVIIIGARLLGTFIDDGEIFPDIANAFE